MRARPRAVFFVGHYRPELFGIGRYVPQYVDALADAGWRVDVYAPFPSYPSWRMDTTIPRIVEDHDGRVRVQRYAPFVPRKHSPATRALHEISIGLHALRTVPIGTWGADLLVAASPPLLGAVTTGWVARRTHTPFLVLAYDLVTDLAGDAFGRVGRIAGTVMRGLEARIYRRADSVIALSDEMAARVRAFGTRPGVVTVIRIWADDELFHLDHDVVARRFRSQHGIPEGRHVLGFAGNFGRKQHLSEIVSAVRELPRDFTSLIVGDGPDRPDLERLARAGPGDVRVLPPQSTADLHALLSACDASIVVAWSRHAGSLFPSKVANVLAAGSPIVAITTRDTELAKILETEDLGVVCPSLDPQEIRHAARHGAESGRARQQRARCRAYAKRFLSREHAMDRFLDRVRSLGVQ